MTQLVTTLSLAFAVAAGVLPSSRVAPPAHCVFREANRLPHRWEGGCGRLFGQEPAMKLKPAKAIESGKWRADAEPSAVWAGTMTDQGYDDAALELELYTGRSGVLRTAYGWYPVIAFRAGRDTM